MCAINTILDGIKTVSAVIAIHMQTRMRSSLWHTMNIVYSSIKLDPTIHLKSFEGSHPLSYRSQ